MINRSGLGYIDNCFAVQRLKGFYCKIRSAAALNEFVVLRVS